MNEVLPRLCLPFNQRRARNLEKLIRKSASIKNLSDHIEYLSEKIGVRVAGTQQEFNAAVYAKNFFETIHVPAEFEEFDALIDRPIEARLKVIEAEKKELMTESFAWSASTRCEGVSSELVFVGKGLEKEYAGKNLRGKIALISAGRIWRGEKVKIAQEREAIGVVIISEYPGRFIRDLGAVSLHNGNVESEDYLPKLPALSTTYEDGAYLLGLMKKGPVRVCEKVIRARESRRSSNVIGTLRGTSIPEEEIILGAHLDNWGPGAYDGGSQLAAMFELARVLKKHAMDIRRTIKFGCWGAHEHGLIGSWTFTNQHAKELEKQVVGHINVGTCVGGKGFKRKQTLTHNSPELQSLVEQIVKEENLPRYEKGFHPLWGDSDHMFFFLSGVASVWARGWTLADYVPFWHTTGLDTFRNIEVNPEIARDMITLIGKITLRLANADVLPYDYTRWVDMFKGELERLTKIETADLMESADAFREVARKFSEAVASFSEAARTSRSKDEYPESCRKANRLLLEVGRTFTKSIFNIDDLRRGSSIPEWGEKGRFSALPLLANASGFPTGEVNETRVRAEKDKLIYCLESNGRRLEEAASLLAN